MGQVGLGILLAGFLGALTHAAGAQFAPFTNEAIQRGITYPMPPLQGQGVLYGCTAGFVDLDGDLDNDVVCLGREENIVGVYENHNGQGQFTNRSFTCGIPEIELQCSYAAGDYDADGDLDLVITSWGHGIHLMRNDGQFTFTDVTAASGLTEFAATEGVSWGDLDGDGWIDLFVCNYVNAIQNTSNAKNRLWHNNGNGTFTDIAALHDLDDTAYSFVSALWDSDLDGDLDILLSNDRGMVWPFQPNRYLRNDGGTFTDIGAQNGLSVALFSMGVACGDLDGNGLPDVYCTNIPSATPPMMGENPLWLQQPGGQFVLSQVAWGVENKKTSWGCFFFDADNDADQDLYVVNQLEFNAFFLNGPHLPLPNIATQVGLAGPTGTLTMDYCASYADVDGDGDLDIMQNNWASAVRLYINHQGELKQWARFRLVGERHDTQALGTTVQVRTGTTWQMRQQINGANGYLSSNDGSLHFGLGTATAMDEIVVKWPYTGSTRTLTNYPAKKHWRLYPPGRMGDMNGDGTVNQADLCAFAQALGGQFAPGKEIFDMNGDAALNGADIALFNNAFTGPRGDLNSDNIVNGDDLGYLLRKWNTTYSDCDLNLDTLVDGADLGMLLASWTRDR